MTKIFRAHFLMVFALLFFSASTISSGLNVDAAGNASRMGLMPVRDWFDWDLSDLDLQRIRDE